MAWPQFPPRGTGPTRSWRTRTQRRPTTRHADTSPHAPRRPALTRQVSKALLQLVLDVGSTERGDVLVHDFICGESRQTDTPVTRWKHELQVWVSPHTASHISGQPRGWRSRAWGKKVSFQYAETFVSQSTKSDVLRDSSIFKLWCVSEAQRKAEREEGGRGEGDGEGHAGRRGDTRKGEGLGAGGLTPTASSQ